MKRGNVTEWLAVNREIVSRSSPTLIVTTATPSSSTFTHARGIDGRADTRWPRNSDDWAPRVTPQPVQRPFGVWQGQFGCCRSLAMRRQCMVLLTARLPC